MKLVVILLSVAYGLVRYGWAKQVPLENWPAFIGNKALALCAVCYLVLGFWHYVRNLDRARSFFRSALIAGVAHGFLSAGLLQAAYYDFLHTESGRLNAFGEFTLLFGGLTLALFFSRATSRSSGSVSGDVLLLVILVGHIISVGVTRWIDPAAWPYGLIPISALSCIVVLCGIFGRLRGGAASTPVD